MDMQDCEFEFLMAGFTKRIGPTEASHIIMEVYIYRLRQMYLGYILTHIARTYNMTVNHSHRVLSITKGHLVRFNDKILALFDDLINQLHSGKFDDVHKFTLIDF